MIKSIIEWSIKNRAMVLLSCLALIIGGLLTLRDTAVDAIPDLSEVQVIVKTSYPGQAPQVVQDQITYPLTSTLLAVPKAKTVRGFSFFGDAFIYVIFEEGTDIYWARARVQEYLNQASSQLPPTAQTQLGPDATGVGWIYMYALKDTTGQHDLSELRSLQDWYLSYELQSVPGVAEIATAGGMVKQYQVIPNPQKLKALGIPLSLIETAIQHANQEVGASVIEMAEAEYMIRATGYIDDIEDLKSIPLGINQQNTPLLLKDVAEIRLGPQMRRGLVELNGEGETVGGIVVMRYGENAKQTITAVKTKLATLAKGLPQGIEIVTVYDRSQLIDDAIDSLWQKLLSELLMVALVCLVFLFHLRSSLVALISLPAGILTAFIVMKWQGLNANIMSLGGIAIAIGAMIDGAIVMIENMHKKSEEVQITEQNRWQLVAKSATEVGPALFFSLLIITISFLPVFTLEAQEGKLFAPLAFTKTYAMAAAAALSITLVPVLMGYCVRGKIRPENKNPVSQLLSVVYRPILKKLLSFPKITLILTFFLLCVGWWPWQKLGSEFMPPLDEGDLMYMPTTYPGISIGKARQLLQQTNKIIKTVPEVNTVFGKVGRADTATDPAPLTMIETFIQLKPKSQWRPHMTTELLKKQFDDLIQFPGVSNAWVMPIKTRIEMLSTGIKTPVGIKIAGPDLKVIEQIGQTIEQKLTNYPGVLSVYAERVAGGRYITVDINRQKAASFGISIKQIQQHLATSVGGKSIGWSYEGIARYPIQLRYPQSYRHNLEALKSLPIVSSNGQQLTLSQVADIYIETGPGIIKSEQARLNGWVYIDIRGVNLGQIVDELKSWLPEQIKLPNGYSLNWSGQYEYMDRVKSKLMTIIPLTLSLIIWLLYLNFRSIKEILVILLTLPFALTGSIWTLYLLDYSLSVAVYVGMIALSGVAVETAVIMLVYLNQATNKLKEQQKNQSKHLFLAILNGANSRLRPVLMTTVATIAGLLPIMSASGTGAEIMSRLAAPMIGGMISALLLTMFILPVIYFLWHQHLINTKITPPQQLDNYEFSQ